MLDQTLTQILNELYRLTASVQQAARDMAVLEQRNAQLAAQLEALQNGAKEVDHDS